MKIFRFAKNNLGESMGLEKQLGYASHSIGLPIYVLFIVPLILAAVFQIAKAFEKRPTQSDDEHNPKSEYFKGYSPVAAIVSILFLAFAGLFSFQVFTGNIHSIRSVNFENLAR